MWHPLDAVRPGRRARVFVPLLGLTAVLAVALGAIDRPLRTAASPLGIVSFEVAGDVATARAMVEAWDGQARVLAALSLGLDYLFLVAYSTTTALACLWAAGVYRARGWALAAAGAPLAWGQWVAALLDGIENAALIAVLLGPVAAPWPAVAWWAAVPKFVLLTAGIGYALGAAVARRGEPGAPR
jgi:hypothetical protein